MIKPLLLAAFVAVPTLSNAQDTNAAEPPAMPAPEVSTESPGISGRAMPETETEGSGVVPSSAAAPELGAETISEASGTDDALLQDQIASDPAPQVVPLTRREELMLVARESTELAREFLRNGGPSIWAIAALSVITVALILWKAWRLALIGAWSRGKAGRALNTYEGGDFNTALNTVKGRRGIRSKVLAAALEAIRAMPEDRAREETARVAKREIANAGTGLRALELIATIAPLLGLLGTVLGMIAAFQALQQAGNRADPALLAGGIWEALLTTAAGMAVAIPASAALTWFEAVIDRIRRDVEDGATRLFIAHEPDTLKLVAE